MDFEFVRAEDARAYARFLARLRRALAPGGRPLIAALGEDGGHPALEGGVHQGLVPEGDELLLVKPVGEGGEAGLSVGGRGL